MMYEAVAFEHAADGADRRQVEAHRALAELFSDLGRAPAGIFPLQSDDDRFNRCWQSICLAVGAPAPVVERGEAAVFVAVEDLVARFARDPELDAQRGHFLALEQTGHKAEPLIHDVTLL